MCVLRRPVMKVGIRVENTAAFPDFCSAQWVRPPNCTEGKSTFKENA